MSWSSGGEVLTINSATTMLQHTSQGLAMTQEAWTEGGDPREQRTCLPTTLARSHSEGHHEQEGISHKTYRPRHHDEGQWHREEEGCWPQKIPPQPSEAGVLMATGPDDLWIVGPWARRQKGRVLPEETPPNVTVVERAGCQVSRSRSA